MLLEATRTSQVKPNGNALTPPKSDEKYDMAIKPEL